MKFVREQCFLAAAAQDLKRLVRFLSNAPMPTLAATTVNLPRRQKNEHNLESTRRVSSLLRNSFNTHAIHRK
jgi:hypothetical protein